jgi:hypothetical protein
MTTVADVLAEIKEQLEYKKTDPIVLTREQAEHLHRVVLDVILERDNLAFELEKIRAITKAAPGAKDHETGIGRMLGDVP